VERLLKTLLFVVALLIWSLNVCLNVKKFFLVAIHVFLYVMKEIVLLALFSFKKTANVKN
jgi:hypothetical protein